MEDTSTILLIIIVVQFLVIAILGWKNAGAIPPEAVAALFGYAERRASATPQTWDDDTIKQLRALYDRLSKPEATPEEPVK